LNDKHKVFTYHNLNSMQNKVVAYQDLNNMQNKVFAIYDWNKKTKITLGYRVKLSLN